jgi:hypothetical protein
METIVIKLPKDKFNSLLLNKVFEQYECKYEIKEVYMNNEEEDKFFKDDYIDKKLKGTSIKSYASWREYRFNKLHNIKTR